MESALWIRSVTVIASVLLAIWTLIPTFAGKEVQDQLEAYAEVDADTPPPEVPFPWYVDYLPNVKVNRGLDLQGGIDLTLEVQTDEAVLATVQRDIQPLKLAAQRDNIVLADVRRQRGHAALMISPGPGVTLEQVQTLLNGSFRYYHYAHSEDVEGRTYFLFEMAESEADSIRVRSVEQALDTIRNRIDSTGVKEPSITRKGATGIDVQLPGETDIAAAVAAIGTTAQLEFILVDEAANVQKVEQGVQAGKAAMTPEAFADDRQLSEWLQDKSYLTLQQHLYWEYEKGPDGKEVRLEDYQQSPLVLKDIAVLTGDDVNDAQVATSGQDGSYYVQLEFKPRGAAIFGDVTGANVNKRFAIVLDSHIRSAPVIRQRIDGVASISMGSSSLEEQYQQATMLALVLRSGALPAPVSVGESRQVKASLGEAAILEGVAGALGGTLLVLLFAGLYYRLSGLVGNVVLLLNALFVVALLAVVGATLTLPGICGIALTIGMAVDCNILVFERIREELREGKGVRQAIDAGFDRAWMAVFDSNLTTLIAGIVLYTYGTGPIRGFAVTLMLGIFTTLFSGVFVSRTFMELVNRHRRSMSI